MNRHGFLKGLITMFVASQLPVDMGVYNAANAEEARKAAVLYYSKTHIDNIKSCLTMKVVPLPINEGKKIKFVDYMTFHDLEVWEEKD